MRRFLVITTVGVAVSVALAAPGAAAAPAGDGVTAAATLGWGAPARTSEFTSGLGPGWGVYDGPGHGGKGRRTPSAVSVRDGVMTITGDPAGNTAGMAWSPGRRYGRWEARVQAPASDPSYHAVLLLWPDAENWPVGGEVDFMESADPSRQSTEMFLHYGRNNSQISGRVAADATVWHNWAVEWAPDHIAVFLDGRPWFRTDNASILPPGPMHLCIQLDWFPRGGAVRTSMMSVDWVREYAYRATPVPTVPVTTAPVTTAPASTAVPTPSTAATSTPVPTSPPVPTSTSVPTSPSVPTGASGPGTSVATTTTPPPTSAAGVPAPAVPVRGTGRPGLVPVRPVLAADLARRIRSIIDRLLQRLAEALDAGRRPAGN